jgi:U3 small nucleolar RNA-associated protein 22
MSLQLQGLSIFDREPMFVGVSVSSLEKAFRVVDIGPNPENKEEVFQFFFFFLVVGGICL